MSRGGVLARMANSFMDWASVRYQQQLGEKLKDYGLRYEDLYDPILDLDVAEALKRLPPQVVLDRNARIKRALDLSMKHEKLTGELRSKQTPFELYMHEVLSQVKAEKAERRELGGFPLYQRLLP